MNKRDELISNYRHLESDINKFELLKSGSDADEDKKFWNIEIESTKKEMKTISLMLLKMGPKAA